MIAGYLPPFGVFIFVAGIFLADGRSAYKTIVDIGTLAPTLALLVYGMAAADFDGGHLIARPIEMSSLLWLPIRLCIRLKSDGKSQRRIRIARAYSGCGFRCIMADS